MIQFKIGMTCLVPCTIPYGVSDVKIENFSKPVKTLPISRQKMIYIWPYILIYKNLHGYI